MLGQYLRWLSRYRSWPISNIQKHSIHEVLAALEGFPDLEYFQETEFALTSEKVNLKDSLRKAAVEAENELKGLCLSCVKHVTSTEKDGNCHGELECHRLAKTQQETG